MSSHPTSLASRCSKDKHLALRLRALRVNMDRALDGDASAYLPEKTWNLPDPRLGIHTTKPWKVTRSEHPPEEAEYADVRFVPCVRLFTRTHASTLAHPPLRTPRRLSGSVPFGRTGEQAALGEKIFDKHALSRQVGIHARAALDVALSFLVVMPLCARGAGFSRGSLRCAAGSRQ